MAQEIISPKTAAIENQRQAWAARMARPDFIAPVPAKVVDELEYLKKYPLQTGAGSCDLGIPDGSKYPLVVLGASMSTEVNGKSLSFKDLNEHGYDVAVDQGGNVHIACINGDNQAEPAAVNPTQVPGETTTGQRGTCILPGVEDGGIYAPAKNKGGQRRINTPEGIMTEKDLLVAGYQLLSVEGSNELKVVCANPPAGLTDQELAQSLAKPPVETQVVPLPTSELMQEQMTSLLADKNQGGGAKYGSVKEALADIKLPNWAKSALYLLGAYIGGKFILGWIDYKLWVRGEIQAWRDAQVKTTFVKPDPPEPVTFDNLAAGPRHKPEAPQGWGLPDSFSQVKEAATSEPTETQEDPEVRVTRRYRGRKQSVDLLHKKQSYLVEWLEKRRQRRGKKKS